MGQMEGKGAEGVLRGKEMAGAEGMSMGMSMGTSAGTCYS